MNNFLPPEKRESSNNAHWKFDSECSVSNTATWYRTNVVITKNDCVLYSGDTDVRLPPHHNYRQVAINLPDSDSKVLQYNTFSADFQEMTYEQSRLTIRCDDNTLIHIKQI